LSRYGKLLIQTTGFLLLTSRISCFSGDSLDGCYFLLEKAKHPCGTRGKVASTVVLRLALPMLASKGAC